MYPLSGNSMICKTPCSLKPKFVRHNFDLFNCSSQPTAPDTLPRFEFGSCGRLGMGVCFTQRPAILRAFFSSRLCSAVSIECFNLMASADIMHAAVTKRLAGLITAG